MKILLLTDGITPFVIGGMQKHSYHLAKYLPLNNVTLHLIHCVSDGDQIPTKDEVFNSLFLDESVENKLIAGNNFSSRCLVFPTNGYVPGHYVRRSYIYSEMVFNEIKHFLTEFDFIYAKGFSAWKLIEEKKKGLLCPPIGVKFHGYEMWQKAPSLRVKLEHYVLRFSVKWNSLNADYVFSYGGKITSIISSIGVQSARIIEIPSAINHRDVRETVSLPQSPLRFVYLGRYERRKGIEELGIALMKLDGKGISFNMDFIGPIPEKHQVKLKNINCTYHGSISDKYIIQSILDSSDVLICPSHSEGMPNVILEAMSRGLAVIATDVGAVRLLVSEKTGWLLRSSASGEIKNAIMEALYTHNDKLIEKKQNAINHISKEYTWEKITEGLIKTISHISRHTSKV